MRAGERIDYAGPCTSCAEGARPCACAGEAPAELERGAPAGFRYLSEDRRRAELDRRAEARGRERRQAPTVPQVLRLVARAER